MNQRTSYCERCGHPRGTSLFCDVCTARPGSIVVPSPEWPGIDMDEEPDESELEIPDSPGLRGSEDTEKETRDE